MIESSETLEPGAIRSVVPRQWVQLHQEIHNTPLRSDGTVFRARRGERLYALKLLYLPHAGAKAWREVEVLLRLHLARLVEVEGHGHYGEHPEAGPLFLPPHHLLVGLCADRFLQGAGPWFPGSTPCWDACHVHSSRP